MEYFSIKKSKFDKKTDFYSFRFFKMNNKQACQGISDKKSTEEQNYSQERNDANPSTSSNKELICSSIDVINNNSQETSGIQNQPNKINKADSTRRPFTFGWL